MYSNGGTIPCIVMELTQYYNESVQVSNLYYHL